MLTTKNIENIIKTATDATGVIVYFNDKAESTSQLKFEMRYKGVTAVNSRQCFATFDLILCGDGVGDAFILYLMNTEASLVNKINILPTSDDIIHEINGVKEYIKIFYAEELGAIESEILEKGKVKYTYKRYFTLQYYFINS